MKLIDKFFEKKFEEFLERKLGEAQTDEAPASVQIINKIPRPLPPNLDLSICNPESGENRWLRLVAQITANGAGVNWFDDWPYPYEECLTRLREGRVDPEHYLLLAAKLNRPYSELTCFDKCTPDDLLYAFAQSHRVEKR